MASPPEGLPTSVVGLDRSDPALLEALSASVASLAHRVNAIGDAAEIREPVRIEVRRRRRGADPRRLVAIQVATSDVADAVASIEALQAAGSWPPDGTSVLVFVRDALRLLAIRLTILDRIDDHDEKPVQVGMLLGEARRRLRQAYDESSRSTDARAAAERAIHLGMMRRLLGACAGLSRAIEIAAYERG